MLVGALLCIKLKLCCGLQNKLNPVYFHALEGCRTAYIMFCRLAGIWLIYSQRQPKKRRSNATYLKTRLSLFYLRRHLIY